MNKLTITISREEAGAVVALIMAWRESLPAQKQSFTSRYGHDAPGSVKANLAQVELAILKAEDDRRILERMVKP